MPRGTPESHFTGRGLGPISCASAYCLMGERGGVVEAPGLACPSLDGVGVWGVHQHIQVIFTSLLL